MKKMLIVLLAGLLMLIAVACKANEAPKEAVKNEEPQEAAQEEIMANEPLAGGWTPAEDFSVTDERKAICEHYNKLMEELRDKYIKQVDDNRAAARQEREDQEGGAEV